MIGIKTLEIIVLMEYSFQMSLMMLNNYYYQLSSMLWMDSITHKQRSGAVYGFPVGGRRPSTRELRGCAPWVPLELPLTIQDGMIITGENRK